MATQATLAPTALDETFITTLGPQGRIVIPAEIRKRMGYEPGTLINIWLDDSGDIRLQSRDAARDAAKAMFRRSRQPSSIVDELIAERHAEADREARED